MHGRIAALIAAGALAGCGTEPATVEPPVPIQIVEATPTAQPASSAPRHAVRSGSYKTAPRVTVPGGAATTTVPVPVVKSPARKPRWSYRRFRATQLKALRAHCATRPKDDPRCDGTRVNERVAFAAYEGTNR